MPGGSKSTGTTTTTQSMPGVNDILGWGKSVAQNGNAWAPNTSSQVTPFSTATMAGLKGLNSTAQGAVNPFANNFTRIKETVGDGGLNNLQDQQVARLQGMAGGNGLNSIQQNALNLLNPIAQGKEMQGNPYLQGVIDRGSQDIANTANLMASGAGRYGSDSHAQALGKNIADFAGGLRFQDYNNQLGRRDAAIQNVFGMGTTGQGQQQNAISSLFNAGTQQRNNVLAGTQQLKDAYDARLDPYRAMMGVGSAYEGKNQALLNDASRIFDAKQNSTRAPVDWLAGLANLFQGGGQQTVTTQPSNAVGGGLGGAIAGYDTFGGPLGALFGGLGGAFL